jgi:Xaa-Pro dipeptidase
MTPARTSIRSIQRALVEAGVDGWLFYDFLHRDPMAYSVLGLGRGLAKRRWFYLIPAAGSPRKLVHRIEALALESLPGRRLLYASRQELEAGLRELLAGVKVVAMQYSPQARNPYVSTVDAGTVELVRRSGVRVVSSGDLVQQFEACWTDRQLASHLAAGRKIDRIVQQAFRQATAALRAGRRLTEYDLQQWMAEAFRREGLTADSAPIVAFGPNSANPHYEPTPARSATIRPGGVLLLDVWGKLDRPGSVYYDVTWVAFTAAGVPERVRRVFEVVRQARDAAIAFVRRAVEQQRPVRGWQVDRVARRVIERAGFGPYFTHRTGHNIGTEVHGNGAHLDSFEMPEDRRILPRTCFSVEPGIYLRDFGIRSEVNVYVDRRQARVTGAVQQNILPLLAETVGQAGK